MPDQFSFLDHLPENDQDEYSNLKKARLFTTDGESLRQIDARAAELTIKGREEEARQKTLEGAYRSEHPVAQTRDARTRDVAPMSQISEEQQRVTDMMYSGQNAPPRLTKEEAAKRRREDDRRAQERIWEANGGFPGFPRR